MPTHQPAIIRVPIAAGEAVAVHVEGTGARCYTIARNAAGRECSRHVSCESLPDDARRAVVNALAWASAVAVDALEGWPMPCGTGASGNPAAIRAALDAD